MTVVDDAEGVLASASGGAGPATFTVCNEALAVNVDAGSSVVITCGSVIVTVVNGAAEVDLGGGVVVEVEDGATATITDYGTGVYTVENTGESGDVIVDDNGDETELEPDDETTVQATCIDLTGDGKTSGRDVSVVARAMFSMDGMSKWNPLADLDNDGIVTPFDLALVLDSLHDPDCR